MLSLSVFTSLSLSLSRLSLSLSLSLFLRFYYSSQEAHSDGRRVHYLSLDFNHGPHEDFDSLTLRCFAQQTYPNGTVIYESSLATKICQDRKG